MADALTLDEVKHIAKLARLHLSEEDMQAYRDQLTRVLDHVDKLNNLDLEDVEPLVFTVADTECNRLDEDEPSPERAMTIDQIAAIAPAMQDRFIAVPKVLAAHE